MLKHAMEDWMTYSNFLRTVLKLDCASCLAMAAMLVIGAASLSDPFGIAAGFLQAAGMLLVPIGLFIGWLGLRGEGAPLFVWMVIAGNFGWTALSFIVASSLPTITAMGSAFVIAQAIAVLSLALLEWRGLRQSRAAVA